ncbi:MAG: inositol monophosphatase family protein [Marinifilaceae bacterium]
MEKLQEIRLWAEQLAREVGAIQLSYFRSDNIGIETKSNIYDVVTRVDKECEQFIREQIVRVYPEHGILGEEGSSYQLDKDYVWVVDPLDGTNNYSQGLPIYCVSIALKYRGEAIVGVVYAPYFNEMFSAAWGHGATMNNKPLQIGSKQTLAESVLGTGFPYDKDVNPDNNAQNLASILPSIRGIRRMGSAAYDLCCVAAGFLDGYWELSLSEWDMCAGALIVEEAGGVVTPFRENRGISIIAGNSIIVSLIAEKIK